MAKNFPMITAIGWRRPSNCQRTESSLTTICCSRKVIRPEEEDIGGFYFYFRFFPENRAPLYRAKKFRFSPPLWGARATQAEVAYGGISDRLKSPRIAQNHAAASPRY